MAANHPPIKTSISYKPPTSPRKSQNEKTDLLCTILDMLIPCDNAMSEGYFSVPSLIVVPLVRVEYLYVLD